MVQIMFGRENGMKIQEGFDRAGRSAHYHASDSNDRIIINLRDLNRIMHLLYEGKTSQKRILILLLKMGSMTQRELTERLDIQPGSASEVLTKLEHAGLIRRSVSEEDRRTADISLTENGRAQAEEALRKRNERHAEMFSCLTETEKKELLALLEKVHTDWEERYKDRGTAGRRGRCPGGRKC